MSKERVNRSLRFQEKLGQLAYVGWSIVVGCLLLAACAEPQPTPTPLLPTATPLASPSSLAVAPFLAPTLTPSATTTPAAAPISTRTPTPTFSPTCTPTPRPSATPAFTPPPAVGPFVLIPPAADWLEGGIRALHVEPGGAAWLVTERGVGRWLDGAWTLLRAEPGWLAGFGNNGQASWIPEGGEEILLWDGAAWTSYGLQSGWAPLLQPLGWTSVTTDHRGWVWLACKNELRTFDGQTWTVLPLDQIGFVIDTEPDVYDGFRVKVARDGEGNIWVGNCIRVGESTFGQGARWFDGTRWAGTDSPITGAGCVSDIELDAHGRLWLGIDATLWRYTPAEGWNSYERPEIDPRAGGFLGYILDIAVGPQGDPWVIYDVCGGASCGNGRVLLRFQGGGHWTQVGQHHWNQDIAFAPDGSAWFCAPNVPPDDAGLRGGVYHVMGNTLDLVAGIGCDMIEVDGDGRVWVASLRELSLLYIYENP